MDYVPCTGHEYVAVISLEHLLKQNGLHDMHGMGHERVAVKIWCQTVDITSHKTLGNPFVCKDRKSVV